MWLVSHYNDEDEIIAADVADKSAPRAKGSDEIDQEARRQPQGLVTAWESVLVVERLEVVDVEHDDDRQLHDSDLSGELNHRTGRLDSGTDPYGWYERD